MGLVGGTTLGVLTLLKANETFKKAQNVRDNFIQKAKENGELYSVSDPESNLFKKWASRGLAVTNIGLSAICGVYLIYVETTAFFSPSSETISANNPFIFTAFALGSAGLISNSLAESFIDAHNELIIECLEDEILVCSQSQRAIHAQYEGRFLSSSPTTTQLSDDMTTLLGINSDSMSGTTA